jgi:Fic family protein
MPNQRLFGRIGDKKALLDSCRPLAEGVLRRLRDEMDPEFIYNSNAIEGNTLTLNETRLVLAEGMTIKGKPLKDHLEATNHKEAIDYIYRLSKEESDIAVEPLLKLHEIVLEGIEKEFSGKYRPGQVRILGANFIPPNALKVPQLMEDFVIWAKDNAGHMNIIEYVATLHYKFVWIHPFLDGNGRVARLLMNLMLIRAGYPPAIILNSDRKKYYNTLSRADRGEFETFFKVIGQAVERSLDLYLRALGVDREELVSLSDLAKDSKYSQAYLSLLARQGKLSAMKLGRNWLSSKKAVEEYMAKRQRKV